MRFDFFDGGNIDQWSKIHLFIFNAGPDTELPHRYRKLRKKSLINAVLHENSICADARLTTVTELRIDRTPHRVFDIRVIENDKRRVASQFQRYLFHRSGALRH